MDFIILIIIGMIFNSVFGEKKKPAQNPKHSQKQAEYEEIFDAKGLTEIERDLAKKQAMQAELEKQQREVEMARKAKKAEQPKVDVKLFGNFGELLEEFKKAAVGDFEEEPKAEPKKKKKHKRKAGSLPGLNPDMATLEGKPIFKPEPVTVAPQMEVIKQAPKQVGNGLDVVTNNNRLTPLQQAMLLSDILEKPKALRR